MAVSGIWLGVLLVCFSRVAISSELHLVSKRYNNCGTWIPYKEAKCVKVIQTANYDKQSAAKICQSYSEVFDSDYSILRVQNEEEQAFFSQLLFEEIGIKDNIWLEFEFSVKKPDVIRGNDSSKMLNVPVYYSNFKKGIDHSQKDGQCVQMVPGTKATPAGRWDRVPCNALNVVVCERPQPVTMESLQQLENMIRLLMKQQVNMYYNTGHQINAYKVCPDKFTKIYGQCYHFSDYATELWEEALKKCENMVPRATLLTLETKEEWNMINDYLSAHTRLAGNYWWIGGSDVNHEGLFTWEKDHQPFAFSEWCPNQPDNEDGNENCIHFSPKSWSGGKDRLCWNDVKCDGNRFNIIPHFICEPDYH